MRLLNKEVELTFERRVLYGDEQSPSINLSILLLKASSLSALRAPQKCQTEEQ